MPRNKLEAYRRAYNAENSNPVTIGRRAQEMLNHKGVAAEIQRLQQRVADAHDVTVESLIRELEEARQLAIKRGLASAAVNATLGKGKLAGLPPPSKIDVTIRRARTLD